MRHRVDDHSVLLRLIHDAMRKLIQRTASDRVLASLVAVCRVSECLQGFGDSALKLVDEPFDAFEQIKLASRTSSMAHGRTSIS